MFKKAVESHKASQSRSNSLKHELFPSSSPDAPRTSFAPFKAPSMKPRPLSTSSGNIGRPDAIHGTEIASSLHKPSLTPPRPPKRTYNGLAKALDNNACSFDFSVTSSQENPMVIDDESVKEPPPVYFDENDFDSDIDLDVEDPVTKGVVEYPKLPEPLPEVSKPASVPSVASTLPPRHDGRQPKLDSGREISADSTYQSASSTTSKHSEPDFVTIKPDIQEVPKEPWKAQRSPENLRLGRFDPTTRATQPANSPSRPPPSSAIPLPWSSSPSEHEYSSVSVSTKAAKAQIREFAYDGDLVQQHHEESPPKTKKRRGLPWQKEEAQERPASPPLSPPPVEPVQPLAQPKKEAKLSKPAGTRQRSIRDSVKSEVRTPLRKSTDKSTFPWNTTASAIKEQQKALKQANKKLVKSHEATPEARKEAIARKKRNNIARVFLSEEQQHVLNLVVDKQKSVFFTGSAGTGKSVLLREIIAALRKKYLREPDRVAVTASTGLAACNIGGVTLHSFSGIGLGKESAEELVKKIKRNQKARHRWMRTKALVIDEISMVDGELFDKLEAVARTIRNNGRPFGGIQLVITGDFFQLPPVPDRGKVAKFAFDAGTWNTAIEHTIALHHVFRQKDPVFANMLNEMREGRLTPESIEAFRKLERPVHWPNQLEATELYPRREQVDQANNMRMQQLEGDLRIFEAKDGGSITDLNFRRKLLENCMAPETVALKKGCQVMLIKNYDETLVNGSLGKVIGFMSDATFDQYEENEEEFHELAKAADEDLNPVQKRMKAKLEAMAASTSQTWPLVRFTLADGTTRDMLCNREQWKVELPNGEVQASRSQVPLILAWALSIHKAQGQTLDRVKVDLGKVFEKGQAYVALSRATSMEGLQVLRFDPKKVMAHERVRNFYKGLSRAEHIVVGESTEVVSAKDKRAKEPVDFATDYERAFMEGYGYDEF